MPARGWFILLVSVCLAAALVTPAVLYYFLPNDYAVATLNRFTGFLLWPAAQIIATVTGSSLPDPAFTIFLTWIIFSVVLWPVLMLLGS